MDMVLLLEPVLQVSFTTESRESSNMQEEPKPTAALGFIRGPFMKSMMGN